LHSELPHSLPRGDRIPVCGQAAARSGSDFLTSIAEFLYARASASPELKIKAIYQAGLSLEADNALALAERNYREILELLRPKDRENFNAVHYRLGRVAEALGNYDAAEEHYNKVAASD
jgi:tetratricopeptide (TPR) repeat protein